MTSLKTKSKPADLTLAQLGQPLQEARPVLHRPPLHSPPAASVAFGQLLQRCSEMATKEFHTIAL